MNEPDEALSLAIREAELLLRRTRKKSTIQVKGTERDIIRATALAWFKNHRPKVMCVFSGMEVADVDQQYQKIMAASHKSAARKSYVSSLKVISHVLVQLRTANVLRLSAAPRAMKSGTTSDDPPDFSPLIQDIQMKSILERRWRECTACITANAPLAATVMMGGLLEGLLLARVNSQANKAPIFTASTAPKDEQGKTLRLKDWTLQNLIDVAHELKWISQTVKDTGNVLRDYRNCIHPQKEFSERIVLVAADATLLWEISKSIATQVIKGKP